MDSKSNEKLPNLEDLAEMDEATLKINRNHASMIIGDVNSQVSQAALLYHTKGISADPNWREKVGRLLRYAKRFQWEIDQKLLLIKEQKKEQGRINHKLLMDAQENGFVKELAQLLNCEARRYAIIDKIREIKNRSV